MTDVANQGLATAQLNLGTMYASGRGVEQDLEKASLLFQQAANQDMTIANYYLAINYLTGWVVIQQLNKTFALAKSTAEAGLGQGQYLLGLLYTNGLGTEEDDQAAEEMYRLAAANNVLTLDLTLYVVDWDGQPIIPSKPASTTDQSTKAPQPTETTEVTEPAGTTEAPDRTESTEAPEETTIDNNTEAK
jgi:hypothetical protein